MFTISCFGQQYEKRQQVQVIIHKIIVPEDGSLKEALALTQEWTENVLRKHENFESIQLLLSEEAVDTLDLVVLYKYKPDIIRSTNQIMQELINQHWPDKSEFDNFMQQLHRYINPELNKRSMYQELVLN